MTQAPPQLKRLRALGFCLLLSLLLHVAVVALLLPRVQVRPKQASGAQRVRSIRIERPQAVERPKDFVKTSADTPQQRPEQAEHIGARDTRAASDPTVREQPKPTPAINGQEEKEEQVTFDQEAQDGDLQHEGKKQQSETPAPPPVSAPQSLTLHPLPKSEAGMLPQHEARTTEEFPEPQPRPRRKSVSYDPALSADAQQPGFRTRERKTRSSGCFIFGRGAALNVEATPRGQYEAEIYRRVARLWYAACDEHRGDIVPGKITVSLRLNRRGQLANMQLIQRSGAGACQQSFTFASIRRAALPPMPPEVQADIVGDLLELIFTFHFD